MTRAYNRQGARHTEGKLFSLMYAQADRAPDYNPDKEGKGDGHVALLERAVAYSARDHGITPEQFKQLVGWV